MDTRNLEYFQMPQDLKSNPKSQSHGYDDIYRIWIQWPDICTSDGIRNTLAYNRIDLYFVFALVSNFKIIYMFCRYNMVLSPPFSEIQFGNGYL